MNKVRNFKTKFQEKSNSTLPFNFAKNIKICPTSNLITFLSCFIQSILKFLLVPQSTSSKMGTILVLFRLIIINNKKSVIQTYSEHYLQQYSK